MKILLANDDGYRAPGLNRLREGLAGAAEITVVAPDRNRSGASNSLTLDLPLRVQRAEEGVWYVINGTPTDCVHIAITGLFDHEFDMVMSGINDGANLGDDVLYSGTVAAAVEGRYLGLPAIALSMVPGEGRIQHFDTGAAVARMLLDRLLADPLPRSTILNVNIPDLPLEQIRGLEATRLG
ncbi:MAG: 5'/3'-nucleotidase SurE, partial [Steroidobacteraceae bacterium]